MNISIRKFLCADALIASIYHQFQQISDPRNLPKNSPISFSDVLMSDFAVFGLKFPSLLQYDQHRKTLDNNLRTLYHINLPPSDTYLRERLDELNPSFIRPAFKKIFAELQRGKCLEEFEFLDGYYLLSLEGAGFIPILKFFLKIGENRCGSFSFFCARNEVQKSHPNTRV